MAGLEQRLESLEARLDELERRLGAPPPAATGDQPDRGSQTPQAEHRPASKPLPRGTVPSSATPPSHRPRTAAMGGSVTRLLGWSGSLALVLAAAYLIKLAYDSGWLALSPRARIGLALMGAAGLIGTGLFLRKRDRHYASFLPATGVVIFFLAIYGAHLYYQIVGGGTAAGGVILTCLMSLWLCRRFDSDLYALFAIVGTYSAPFLIHNASLRIWPLIFYFLAWGLGFCLFSLLAGRRLYYLLALYLALIGFELVRHTAAPLHWQAVLVCQTLQLLIFGVCAALFTLRHKRALDPHEAGLHLPALLIYYALQYNLLHRHLPGAAPWLALSSVAAVGLAYLATRLSLGRELPGGRLLAICYASLAILHAGYLELTAPPWRPWLALLALPAILAWLATHRSKLASDWPLLATLGALWLFNFLQALGNRWPIHSEAYRFLGLFHALELYGGYALLRHAGGRLHQLSGALIYLGHLAAMAAAWRILHSSLSVSLTWGLLALLCLGLALPLRDRMLGQSSLLLFAFSAFKVLLFDLADAAPPIRIGCLLVVGITFYIGGWLYRRIEGMASANGP